MILHMGLKESDGVVAEGGHDRQLFTLRAFPVGLKAAERACIG